MLLETGEKEIPCLLVMELLMYLCPVCGRQDM